MKRKDETLEKSLKDCSWYLDEFLNLPKRVQELLLVNNIREDIIPCTIRESVESPIEQIFKTAFDLYMQLLNKEYIFLFSQVTIKVEKKKYIVDFYFEQDQYVNRFDTDKKIIIECDGHEFHQKTKEQVERDNTRMRDLQKQGYEVIRFSGTEIWHRPYKCASDILNIILSKCKYIKEVK